MKELQECDDLKPREFDSNKFKIDAWTRMHKKDKEVVMHIVPKHLNPKLEKDINFMSKNCLESLSVEYDINSHISEKYKQPVNIFWNPKNAPAFS